MDLNLLPVELLLNVAKFGTVELYRELLLISKFRQYILENKEHVVTLLTEVERDSVFTKYRLFGKLHRKNGPARESPDYHEYYLHGKFQKAMIILSYPENSHFNIHRESMVLYYSS